ncbi:universal stress protein [Zhouia sp. PK063]|uniref:universal stress protein n=1 Tax=Zhouia sp. PK063 TaxID=3373602 RepID=UPI0037B1EC1B
MKNILVPIGTSSNATNTLQYAIDFAEAFNSDIYVMQAFSAMTKAGTIANVEEVVERTSIEQLQDIVAKVDKKNVTVKILTYKGEVVSGLKAIDSELGIDLIILEPKSNDIREELFLGHTSGSIIKHTDIPALIVPEGNTFTPPESILTAFKSGILKDEKILKPLLEIKDKFSAINNLLLVKTPLTEEEDLEVNPALTQISEELITSINTSTFEGVLEHFQTYNPDMLCVFRRKRGFFTKLWEKNTILKSEFRCSIPVLVLSVKKY